MRTRVVGASLAVLTLAWAMPCDAQPDVDESRRNAIVRAIERAAPAVVSVNVVQLEAQPVRAPFEQLFRDFFYDARRRYRVRERRVDSVGSGFIFDAEGHIITNTHVIEDAERVSSVTLPDGRTLDAELVGTDPRTDITVLKVGGANLPHVPLGDSDALMTGEWAIAIGNPFGMLMADAQPTASVGVISANHRRVNPSVGGGERLYQDMIQTDAAINPGNSGGPLVNARGEAVGVNTMIFSKSGGNIGLGFAIPINRVRRVAEEIIRYGRRRDPWPGFEVADVQSRNKRALQELGITAETGCLVVSMLSDSPAYEAGLRPGDVIQSVNGQPINAGPDLDFAIWSLFIGDKVDLELDRKGAPLTLTFPIQELAT